MKKKIKKIEVSIDRYMKIILIWWQTSRIADYI